jgi:WD40 repeat protein
MPEEGNPYVGPRPFERRHAALFFGRDREVNELVSLIISHTEVLLYSQSGAGKSSLVNARLIPLLEAEGFDVLPPARVQGVVEGIDPREIGNIYAFHTMMSWADRVADPKQFARISLADFLRTRKCPVDDAGNPVLRIAIFDQFEELFSAYPDRWQERRGFFIQVREATKEADSGLRTVFVMREDYLAEIDPYVTILPERFRTRFRLERMLEQRALDCVQKPLENTRPQRRFAPGVAKTLIDQLLLLKTTGLDGKPIVAKDQFVELVQLQVVCQSLWEQLKPDDYEIGMDDLASADPSKALLNFYERCIVQTAERTGVPENKIRRWFERDLITPAGTRGTVFRGDQETRGLPNAAVDVLENLHIIRGEVRGRGRWYELTHDRFIESVQISRQRWSESNAATEAAVRRLEKLAERWTQQGRGRKGLLDVGQLLEAERVLRLPAVERLEVSDTARSLVDTSRVVVEESKQRKEEELRVAKELAAEQQRRAEEHRAAATRERRNVKILAAILVVALATATWAIIAEKKADAERENALRAHQHAENARMRATVRQLAGQAWQKQDELDVALLLALEARITAENLKGTQHEKSVARTAATSSLLRTLLGSSGLQRLMYGHNQPVRSVALSEDGKTLASGDMDGVIRLWTADGLSPSRELDSEFIVIYSVALSPDGEFLAACGKVKNAPDKTILLWKVGTASRVGNPLATQGRQVAFSPDGKWLASPSGDRVLLWSIPDLNADQLETQDNVERIAFRPNVDRLTLAAGGTKGNIRLWDLASKTELLSLPVGSEGETQLYSLVFSPEGSMLASGWLSKKIVVWNLDRPEVPRTLAGHSSPVFALAFSADGRSLVSGGTDRTIQRWDLNSPTNKPELLSGYAQEIHSLVVSKKNEVFAGTGKGTIAVWDLKAKDPRLAERINLPLTQGESVRCVSLVGENGKIMAFGTSAGRIFLWNPVRQELSESLSPNAKPVLCIASNPDGRTFACGSDEGIIFWSAAGQLIDQVRSEKGAISALAFRPDGQVLASNTAGKEILFWDVARKQPLDLPALAKELNGPDAHAKHVTSLVFSPDGKQLAAGDEDEKVLLWDATTGARIGTEPLCEFDNPTYSPIHALAYSSTGQLAAAGRDPKILLCDATGSPSKPEVKRLEKHKAKVTSLAFSPNGETLASASEDGALILWDVPSEQFISSLMPGSIDPEKQKPIIAVAFNRDGSRLLTAGSEIFVWDLSLESWRQRADSIALRNLPQEQRDQILPPDESAETRPARQISSLEPQR